jgi:ABC-type arginine transport system permease subunit
MGVLALTGATVTSCADLTAAAINALPELLVVLLLVFGTTLRKDPADGGAR